MYASTAGMLLHEWEVYNWKIAVVSVVIQFRSELVLIINFQIKI
jgi:hypothetical protein